MCRSRAAAELSVLRRNDKNMRVLILGCLLSFSTLCAETHNFTEIELALKVNKSARIATKEQAEKVLLGEIAKPTGGISAYWFWSIRDAFMLPDDLEGIGVAGDVVWIGQLNDTNEAPFRSEPLAIYFINATTGNVHVIKRSPAKDRQNKAPQAGPGKSPLRDQRQGPGASGLGRSV